MEKVGPEEFIAAWQASRTIREVAVKLGMSEERTAMRAAHCRRRGVKLKAIGKPGRKPLDVAGLNALIDRLKK